MHWAAGPTRRAPDSREPIAPVLRPANWPAPAVELAAPAAVDRPSSPLPAKQIHSLRRSPVKRPLPAPRQAQGLDGPLATRLDESGKVEFRRGLYVVLVAVGLAGTWAGFVPLSGAVMASGSVVTASNVKKIQHPAGGVVREILVRDGSKVNSGDVLLKLDPTNVRANLQIAAKRLLETRALIRRLTAERDGAADAALLLAPIEGISEAEATAVLAAQRSLFEARDKARGQQTALQRIQLDELQHSIESSRSQLASRQDERGMVATELTGIEALFRDKLVTVSRVMALRRDQARLDGDAGALQASIAETQSKIAETKLQLARQREDFQMQVLADLREAEGKESELVEQHAMALEQLREIDIRAPQAGTIHDLSVHTLGGVVGPGEALMLIAPDSDDLQVEAQLQPKDIDQVTPGQTAMLRFAAFDRNSTPELRGTVSYVSPDTTRDPRSNAALYTTRISIPAEEVRRLGDLHLIAGMPAEIYLVTESRTALTYLTKPLFDQVHRMFRGR